MTEGSEDSGTDVAESTEAIRAFARDCLRGIAGAPHPRPPADFTFEARVYGAEPVTLQLAHWTDALLR